MLLILSHLYFMIVFLFSNRLCCQTLQFFKFRFLIKTKSLSTLFVKQQGIHLHETFFVMQNNANCYKVSPCSQFFAAC